jgi:hypothetical protein
MENAGARASCGGQFVCIVTGFVSSPSYFLFLFVHIRFPMLVTDNARGGLMGEIKTRDLICRGFLCTYSFHITSSTALLAFSFVFLGLAKTHSVEPRRTLLLPSKLFRKEVKSIPLTTYPTTQVPLAHTLVPHQQCSHQFYLKIYSAHFSLTPSTSPPHPPTQESNETRPSSKARYYKDRLLSSS